MTEHAYAIRYRATTGRAGTALIVEDDDGWAYLLTRQGLGCAWRSTPPPRPIARFLREASWVPVPRVAPYTLADLCRLVHLAPPATGENGPLAAK
jgi:hypothetical protein